MLRGKRLTLRLIERRDLELLRQWRNSPEVFQFFEAKELISEVEQERWFEKVSLHKSSYYFIIETKDGPVGTCNIKNINWVHRTATSGMYFVSDPATHYTLPVEAVILLLDYAFESLNLRKMYGDVLAVNERAVKFNKKLGYKAEGVREKQVFHNGQYVDLVLIGLLRERYRETVAKYRSLLFD